MDAPDHETVIHLNESKSFEQVYLMYAKPLFRLSYSMLQDVQESEEIVQTVFHSLWERRDTLIVHSSIEAYLVRAVKLKAMQYLRDKSNEQKHIALFSQQLARGQNDTEQRIEYKLLTDRLETLTAGLPGQCQQVFTLSRKKGMTNSEISSLLNITEKAVENQITRALRYLRKGLVGYINS